MSSSCTSQAQRSSKASQAHSMDQQIVWSKSWRIGCGYTVYKERGIYHRFYACNYGPGGNVMSEPLYKKGKPCSACPVNTCCGKSCGKRMDYPGLCKMRNPNTAPVYLRNSNDLLFFCDTAPETKACAARVSGTKTWKRVNSFSGYYDSIELKGGQSTKVKFKKEIKPSTSGFCLRVVYRKSPSKAGENDRSVADLEIITANKTTLKTLRTSTLQFLTYEISLGWNSKTKVSGSYFLHRYLVISLPLRSVR
ncbi:CRISP/Allergen/PR-1 [Araneus ventricosus]|uniref:CRISP/Allergen/PR-1 n=1 Tax=Araneus ventricosus TaxID=182803 RepID=A0A4Y2EWY1_ARAVE|nr:CRISP/Allergen/PR-1 [Araneus ventricosus]